MQIINIPMKARSGMTTAALSLLNGYRSKGINAYLLTHGDNQFLLHRENNIPYNWMIGNDEGLFPSKRIVIIDNYEYENKYWRKKYNCDITHHLERLPEYCLAFIFIETPSMII